MADTLEYSSVALPLSRLDDALLRELKRSAVNDRIRRRQPGDQPFVHRAPHDAAEPVFAERHAIEIEHGIKEYGDAIKELIQANIFPGDMLYKNFGVTRHGRVVFYDYDEIEYLTDCNVRRVPPPRNEEDEMSGEPWYTVGPHDIFPETYDTFLLGDPRVRRVHETSRRFLRPRALAKAQGTDP
jgi:isocitrate dehydrogenase kinase/phosphatase